jgi:hypothetical protein
MRIIKGGLILKHLGGKDYLAKDDDGTKGLKVSEVPLKMTKSQIIKILQENNVTFNKSDSKKRLQIKLNILYNYNNR